MAVASRSQTKPKRETVVKCTIGLHPTDKATGRVICACGGYADKQCCEAVWFRLTGYGPCPVHKCGPRVGCRCPLPTEPTAAEVADMHAEDEGKPPVFEEATIGVSRPTWEGGQVVVDDIEWVRKPDGSWRCGDDRRKKLSLDAVFEQIRKAVTIGDVAIVTRTAEVKPQ